MGSNTLVYNIPLLSILLPLFSALAIPFLGSGRQALALIRLVQGGIAVLSAVLLAYMVQVDTFFTFQMGHTPAPWGNLLRVGPLEGLLALVFSLVMLLSLTGGEENLQKDIPPHRQGAFCLLMQLLYTALLAMVYTDDLFTAYVFIEIAAITACLVVVAKESGRSVVAAIRYLMFSCLGSGLILLGISLLYALTGHLLFSGLGEAVSALWESGEYRAPLLVSALVMTLGLAIKSAQVPFHAWLPDAHASATTAASAVLSGLVLKGYVVILIKLMTRVFGQSFFVDSHLCDLLFFLGLGGMLFASVAALGQEEVKGMIAYSSSAQISYLFLALGLGSRYGLVAACFQLVAHACTKSMIFLGAGAMISRTGGHYWGELRGAARKTPLGGLAFTVGGLSLCGIPLLAGFSAKFCLAGAALQAGWQMVPALFGLAASSVLNAMYYIPAILVIWGRYNGDETPIALKPSTHWQRTLALSALLALNLLLGTAFGPIRTLLEQGIHHF